VVTELGVDVLQGFLLARPAPPDHVTRILASAGAACGTTQGH
jgi:EAL domain-containing protein (putative c-di-GMP-specific phosphodiesterase class I)